MERIEGIALLDGRRHPAKEFFINFFEYCNMACGFCWQNHSSTEGMDTVLKKADLVIDYHRAHLEQPLVLNLMGGELFADAISDATVAQYYHFIDAVRLAVPPSQLQVYWVTNLVYTHTSRASDLVDHCRKLGIVSDLTTSYDPKGRFDSSSMKKFTENFFDLCARSYVRTVSVVLTQPTIQALLKDGDYLLQTVHDFDLCELYFDTYSPERNHAVYAPTDKELGDILVWLCDRMPRAHPIASLIERSAQPLSCRTSVIVHPSGEVGRCGSLVPPSLSDAMEVAIHRQDNSAIEAHSIQKYDCLTCAYYTVCGMGCFLLQNLKREETGHGCPYQRAYLHTEKPSG